MACVFGASAQEVEDPALSGMSRDMRIAIRMYESGDDIQAMDRFMDVLTKGDPSERSIANEYINLITHRMNSGDAGPAPRPESVLRRAQAEEAEPLPPSDVSRYPARSAFPEAEAPQLAAAGAPAAPRAPYDRPMPTPRQAADGAVSMDRGLMKSEIKAKLRASLDQGVAELRAYEDVRVLMMSNGDPHAIGIPAALLFQQGIAFQKDAVKILDALTKIVFAVGGAQAVILPEGTAIGDAKVLDMRRTMGISAHFFAAGVAPPRVRVNLLNSQVDLPRGLQDFRGIVVLFVYNQPLTLTVENLIGEEAGPPVSLGVFPGIIRPDKGEGSVIEFSVQDPPSGLMSWRFQLLEPSEGAADLAALQEVLGGGPVFHQIYWNGRRNYFGSPLAPGRYEAVLTATDGKNRQRTLHRWVQVLDAAGNAAPPPKPAAPAAQPGAAASQAAAGKTVSAVAIGAPSADLPGAKPGSSALIKEIKRPLPIQRRAAGKRPASKKAKEAAPAEAAAEEPTVAMPTPGKVKADPSVAPAPSSAPAKAAPAAEAKAARQKPSYQLDFTKNTHQLTRDAERRLAEAAQTVALYPLEALKIHGFAQPGETAAATLAERRAKMVAGLLINKYQIDPKRIQVTSAVSESATFRVQLSFVKDE